MELLIEEVVIGREISDYEIERNKPMPTLIHGIVQANIGFELKTAYRQKYLIASEVTLDTLPKGSTPDLIILPNQKVNLSGEVPAKYAIHPLATIEIQSASQSLDEMVNKSLIYFEFGVKSCWIVQPRIKAIIVFSGPDEYKFFHHDDVLKDSVLDIELDLQNIFE
jgi:Uma2 family endonuclease